MSVFSFKPDTADDFGEKDFLCLSWIDSISIRFSYNHQVLSFLVLPVLLWNWIPAETIIMNKSGKQSKEEKIRDKKG